MSLLQKLVEVKVGADEPAHYPKEDEFGNSKLLSKVIFKLFFPEYILVPVFYALGKFELFHVSMAIQGLFLLFSGTAQWLIYSDHKRRNSAIMTPVEARLDGHVQKLMLVPVGRLHIPKDIFAFISQLPNCIHVQQTAVVAAASYASWTPSLQQEWAGRWAGMPLVGGLIGWTGVPGLLLAALAVSVVVHGLLELLAFVITGDASEGADVANLLFLGKVAPGMKSSDAVGIGISCSRLVTSILSKLPMLYLKTSLATITWQCATPQARKANLIALGLAWYALLPAAKLSALRLSSGLPFVLVEWCKGGRSRVDTIIDSAVYCCMLSFFLVLAVLLLHLLGIYACESHDLAVSHLGCTPASGRDVCAFAAVNATAP